MVNGNQIERKPHSNSKIRSGFWPSGFGGWNLFRKSSNSAQSTIEFTFSMIVVVLLIYAMVMVFRWAGLDLAERRFAHEDLLTARKDELTNKLLKAEHQLNPNFSKPRKLDAVFRGLELKQ